MDKKSLTIGTLSITALILVIANVLPLTPPAFAEETIKDRDYQIVTARVQQGGEGLYILDVRSGQVAVFTWDAGTQRLQPRAVRPMADFFER